MATYLYFIKPYDGPMLWPESEYEPINPLEMRRAKKARNKT